VFQIHAEAFWLPKRGNTDAEYEDAVEPARLVEAHVSEFRCAIADGATESSFAAEWARLLTQSYVRRRWTGRALERRISEARAAWQKLAHSRPLPWYAEEGVRRGAFAAFVGLSTRGNGNGGTWKAHILGDSCLFQVRGEQLVMAQPLESAAAFNSNPYLLCSIRAAGIDSLRELRIVKGTWQPGDIIVLATDAVSQWLHRELERGASPWPRVLDLGTPGTPSFAAFIASLREDAAIRNDDSTLLRLEFF
jgi:hypothetical protein